MHIGILGPIEVRTDAGDLAEVPGARLRGLLVALALRAGHPVPRATLVDWIWGEQPPAEAANALQRLVSRLRKALPDGAVEGLTDGYRLAVDPDAVDAVRFERLLAAARAGDGDAAPLREALALWRGAALEDAGLPESAALTAAAARLDGLRLQAMEDRFDAEVTLGRGPQVLAELSDAAGAHPLRERLAAALMRALAAAGRDSEALLVFQRTREALSDELGVDPGPELSALHTALLRGEVGRQEVRRSNLRAELTSFVGREADVAAVRALVAGHRLTTLTGPGGAGKTRLATETARGLLPGLPDGAWLVELAAIGADGDVAQATLAALGLRDALFSDASNADLTDRLVTAVRDREALLILDNCEHVIEAAAALAHRLLGECRRLRILATSREPLGITGEALWMVEPLPVPEPAAGPGAVDASPALRLLRDRAAAVRKDFAADAETLPAMIRLCRALDGMPLAIELAAARLRSMSIEQLANRLDDRFRLLTGGSRTAMARHRTLRAVVDWSWELLSDAERTVLRRLSVFAGGASLEAAERVCGGDEVLDLLTSLVEKSLLVVGAGGAPRYRMLGTIKEYARDRLAEAGEADLARHAHLAWCTELAEAAEPQLRRAGQLAWLATLGAEHDNIGAAMRGALAAGDAAAAMRLAAAAGWYWWLSGHKAEGMELIRAATETPGEVPDDTRATVYGLMVMFVTSGRGDEHQAADWIRRAYAASRNAPRRHPLMGFTVPLERMLHAPDEIVPAFESLLDDPDPWARALARLHLGKMRLMLGYEGRDAESYLETALAEFRALGERYGISFALTELAECVAMRGEFAAASAHYDEAVAVVSEVGAVEDVIRMRSRQAVMYRLLGDEDAGAAAIAEAERCAERVTWPDALAEIALTRAVLARGRGDGAEAHRQIGIATALQGPDAELAAIRAVRHDLLGYLATDVGEAREHRRAAYRAATEGGHAPIIAAALVGLADLALRRGEDEQAARLLGAAVAARGREDRTNADATRIEARLRARLGDGAFARAATACAAESWEQLAAATLAG